MEKGKFRKRQQKKQAAQATINKPEVMGLCIGSSFDLDKLSFQLILEELLIGGVADTQLIQAAGRVDLGSNIFHSNVGCFIEIIEIKDIPNAVFKAIFNAIWRARMIVSKMIEVKRPFIMARDMIHRTGQSMPMV